MRNVEHWQPTKYETHRGRIRASRNVDNVSVSSRLITDLVGEVYTRLIPKHCQGSLLDLGCGHVPFYGMYREYVEKVTCVDWAESLHQNQFLDHCHDLTQPLPLPDESFNVVICSDVLEHISQPANVWHEMQRVLKPGGVVLLNVPFLYLIHEEPYDFHRYTEFGLKHYAETAGLEVEELRSIGSITQVFANMLGKLLIRLPGGTPLSRVAQKLGNFNSKTTVDRCLASSGNSRWPLLYFIVARKPSLNRD